MFHVSYLLFISILCPPVTLQGGTTPEIEKIFIGRCLEYNATVAVDILPRVQADCSELWGNFSKGFIYSDTCQVQPERYVPFLQMVKQTIPKDKAMFWEGVEEMVNRFSRKGQLYVTMADTMIGYMINSLTWCGQLQDPGINYTYCPAWGDCKGDAMWSYFIPASKQFASQAQGEVSVMLTCSNPDSLPYERDTFFGNYELPNLNVSSVTRVNVFLTHNLDKPKLYTCASQSLMLLKQDVEARGLQYQCIDDPPAVMHMLCSDNPEAQDCQLFKAQACSSATKTRL